MFCLPPHMTHACKPLDVSVYQSLKLHWSDVCYEYLQQHPICIVAKFKFSQLFAEAWSRRMSISIILLMKCGVYPFNPDAIKIPSSVPFSDNYNERMNNLKVVMVKENALYEESLRRALICSTQEWLAIDPSTRSSSV